MITPGPTSGGMLYEIKIQGRHLEQWSRWFSHMVITPSSAKDRIPMTILTVRVPDQAKLRGILNKIWDLNLTVLSVNCIDDQFDKLEDDHE